MSASRHHHYLSQCYLKGFTQGNAKKSKLTVIDLKESKTFETTPRNVGGIRDFNRVEIEGVDPEVIEKAQSEFESKVAKALQELPETLNFSGETKDLILELIGMLAIKSPEMREHLSKPLIQIAKMTMAMTLEAKERWESQITKVKADTGEDISNGKTYEEMKAFVEGQEYDIAVKKEHKIHMELIGMQQITELLHMRNWTLVKAGGESGEFITTDNPVSLTWHNPDQAPQFMSPGFGLRDTMVYFPISKKLALVGEFDRDDAVAEANKPLVAILNSKIIANSYQRVFAAKNNFNYVAKGGEICKGNTLLKRA
ncbi:DUF4238 domain-containing protein [Vreelandella zhanjiangensis]|uniref:DUF4238 domain-containing protein n=1 Tax=Vreelandella zhanjiangensis TaxID=1121960 RepID=UPI00036093A9|nr:DUF4238 domain-containing protein [Halomonas zhanjiangensis]